MRDPAGTGGRARDILESVGLSATPNEVTTALREVRFGAQIYTDTSLAFLKSTVFSGRPVIALVNYTAAWGGLDLKYIMLTGYDSIAQTFSFIDNRGRPEYISSATLEQMWNWTAGGSDGDYMTGIVGVKSRTMIYYAG